MIYCTAYYYMHLRAGKVDNVLSIQARQKMTDHKPLAIKQNTSVAKKMEVTESTFHFHDSDTDINYYTTVLDPSFSCNKMRRSESAWIDTLTNIVNQGRYLTGEFQGIRKFGTQLKMSKSDHPMTEITAAPDEIDLGASTSHTPQNWNWN